MRSLLTEKNKNLKQDFDDIDEDIEFSIQKSLKCGGKEKKEITFQSKS